MYRNVHWDSEKSETVSFVVVMEKSVGTWLGVCNTYLVLFHLSFEPWSRQILLLLLFFFPFIVFSHSIYILLQRIF